MGVEVRAAEHVDIDHVQTVAERAWYTAHAPIIGTEATERFLDEYYDAESFHSRIEDDVTIFHVATDPEGSIVGFAMASPDEDDPTTFHLGRIYVRPDRWGEGIGQQLLAAIEDEVEQEGGTRIALRVMTENERAVTFYEAAGYTQKDEIYDDAIETASYIYVKNNDR